MDAGDLFFICFVLDEFPNRFLAFVPYFVALVWWYGEMECQIRFIRIFR